MFARTLPMALALVAMTSFALAQGFDTSPEQKDRPRAEVDKGAVGLLGGEVKLAKAGTLTVATVAERLPFATYATDTKTVIGSDPDVAQLVADSLGLKLDLVPVAWADWPLGLTSGKYDAVISNVTVTEQRKEKFDFSTYRQDQLGFYARADSTLSIKEPKDVAGLRVIVSAGTNQEQILVRWSQANVAAGLKPVTFVYLDDDVLRSLAIQAGRADAYLGPNALAAVEAARDGKTKLVGAFNGGWPLVAEIAVTTRRGAGLAEAITQAINTQIANGTYSKLLARWNLSAEAIQHSRTNPPGLPRS